MPPPNQSCPALNLVHIRISGRRIELAAPPGFSGRLFSLCGDKLRSLQTSHPYKYMSPSKGKTLVVSRDPKLADIRKTTLEAAGFTVIPAMDDSAVEQACSSNGIQLIMLGYSLPPADKRRVWAKSREYCNVPILELHKGTAPELVERNVFAHESKHAEDFLHSVERLLLKPRNSRA